MYNPNLSVNIGKLKLKNPVMVASGTFGYGKEFEGLVNLKELGAIIAKTITLKPRQGNAPPRTCETPAGMLNAIGLQNEGVDNFIREKLPYLEKIGAPIVASASGDSIKEFVELAHRLDKTGVNAIELNLSCPNIKHNRQGLIAQDPKSTYEVVRAVRRATNKTLIAKLSPNVTDITEIAVAAQAAGADALSLVNTFFGMSVDIYRQKSKLANITGGLSGPAIKPAALYMVWQAAKQVKIPVIGIGGIMNADDALEFIIAGASAVAVGTANLVNPKSAAEIIKGIKNYLINYKIKDVNNLVGILNHK